MKKQCGKNSRWMLAMAVRAAVPTAASMVVMGMGSGVALAGDYIGPSGGNWANPGNWSPAGVPSGAGSTADVRRSPASDFIMYLDYTYTAASALSLMRVNSFTSSSVTVYGGADMYATTEIIGDFGPGRGIYVQPSLKNVVQNLYVAESAGCFGEYYLTGNGPLNVSSGEYVGYQGNGSFTQNAGIQTCPFTYVGYFGSGHGTYTQDGGTNTIGSISQPGLLHLGESSGSSGSYALSGTGNLIVNGEEITGVTGNGSFTQSGGTHVVTGNEYVGTVAATYTHSAGSHTIGTPSVNRFLSLGPNAGGNGTYDLSGSGSLTVNGTAYVGGSNSGAGGVGKLNISGGTATIKNLKVWNTGGAAPAGTRVSLSAGTLSLQTIDLSGNLNRFNWTGGTLEMQGGLRVEPGGSLGSSLNLSSGKILSTNTVIAGETADNGSITVTGGVHSIGTSVTPSVLVIGEFGGDVGNYFLSNGGVVANGSELIGFSGTGSFVHTGGIHNVRSGASATGDLVLGANAGSSGSYDLSGSGGLSVDGTLYVGGSGSGAGGTGVFNMSGGSADMQKLKVYDTGAASPGGTHVSISGGTLTTKVLEIDNAHRFAFDAGVINLTGPGTSQTSGGFDGYPLVIGSTGPATFNQTGGTHNVDSLYLGNFGASGSYNLAAGAALTVNNNEVVGANGPGTFTQTGGTHNPVWGMNVGLGAAGHVVQSGGTCTMGSVADPVVSTLGQNFGVVGTYDLSGSANVTVIGTEVIGYNGTGIFTQSGGTQVVQGEMSLGFDHDGNGSYTLSGGSLSVGGGLLVGEVASGSFSQSGGSVTVAYPAFHSDLTVASEFASHGTYTLSGNGAITVNGNLVIGGVGIGVMNQSGGSINASGVAIAQTVGSSGNYNMSGGSLTAASMLNNGRFDVSLSAVVDLGPIDGTGLITVTAGSPASSGDGGIAGAPAIATINAEHIRQQTVGMTGGKINIKESKNGGPEGVSVIERFRLDERARFDLTNNKLIVIGGDIGTPTGGNYGGLTGLIQSAYDFGSWKGNGITTSMPDAVAGLTTIAIATGEQMRGLRPTDTDTFAGQTINGASVVLMYTYAGDANLDGTIDGGDYGIIDNFVQVPGASGYANGDFNYDGVIDGGDYGIIDNNIQAQRAPFPTSGVASLSSSSVTAVPEPAACGFALAAAAALCGLHRRHRRLGR